METIWALRFERGMKRRFCLLLIKTRSPFKRKCWITGGNRVHLALNLPLASYICLLNLFFTLLPAIPCRYKYTLRIPPPPLLSFILYVPFIFLCAAFILENFQRLIYAEQAGSVVRPWWAIRVPRRDELYWKNDVSSSFLQAPEHSRPRTLCHPLVLENLVLRHSLNIDASYTLYIFANNYFLFFFSQSCPQNPITRSLQPLSFSFDISSCKSTHLNRANVPESNYCAEQQQKLIATKKAREFSPIDSFFRLNDLKKKYLSRHSLMKIDGEIISL